MSISRLPSAGRFVERWARRSWLGAFVLGACAQPPTGQSGSSATSASASGMGSSSAVASAAPSAPVAPSAPSPVAPTSSEPASLARQILGRWRAGNTYEELGVTTRDVWNLTAGATETEGDYVLTYETSVGGGPLSSSERRGKWKLEGDTLTLLATKYLGALVYKLSHVTLDTLDAVSGTGFVFKMKREK
ncbi:MAG: hypothetical protein U0414_05990 [Polyangiaceae bacterium]